MFLEATALVRGSVPLVVCAVRPGWPTNQEWLFLGAVLTAWLAVCLLACARQIRRRLEVLAVGLLALAMSFEFLAFYDPVTNWLHGDDYYRALMSVEWAHGPAVHPDHPGCGWCHGQPVWLLEHDGPFIYPGDMSWLPLQFYVYGAVYPLVKANLHLGFTLVSQVLGFVTVVMLYMLARELFSPRAAIVSAALLALTSWHVIVSVSCLAEPLYYALSIGTLYWLNRWLRQRRRWQLAVLAVAMMLLGMTRYEAWILMALVGAVVAAGQLRSRERSWWTWLSLVLPWVLPAVWCLRSFQVHGHLLNYYSVNRFWFEDAMGQWSMLRRLRTYPEALWDVSHVLCLLFVVAVVLGRRLLDRRSALLCAIAAAHLGALVALFALGSAPLFVERIVLFHFALMLPVVASLLVRAAQVVPPVARVLAVALLVGGYGFEHLERADRLFSSGQHCDHANVRAAYAELGTYLRSRRSELGGQVVVADDDRDHIVSVISSLPRRVSTLSSPDQAPVLCPGGVEVFCFPTRDLGRGWLGPPAEQAFIERNVTTGYRVDTIGPWRVYELINR